MNTRNIIILTASAAALASCAPVPAPYGQDSASGVSGPAVSAPVVKQNLKVPTGHPDPQNRPNMVVSPYRPYNIIDVKGYKSGEIVGDPSTAKVNPSTGKPDLSTSKHFRIP